MPPPKIAIAAPAHVPFRHTRAKLRLFQRRHGDNGQLGAIVEIAAAVAVGIGNVELTFVLDGVTVVGKELLDLIDPDKVESMYIDKSEKSKPVIRINTKKKK